MKTGTKSFRLEVISPVIQRAITAKNADRLNTLDGKTICEGWKGWRSDITFPVIRDSLQQRFPNTRFIPYPKFNDVPESHIIDELKKMGCDAVLIGNGG